jgi:hypothetical protein
VVKASDLNLKLGDVMLGFVSGTSQTTDPLSVGVAATALYDQMPDSLAFAGGYTLPKTGTCSAPGFVSRLTHGDAGEFDILLPNGTSPVEPRAGSPSGSYALVYSLGNIVVSPGTASVSGATPNGSAAIPLGGIADFQHVSVTLNGVQDSTGATFNNLVGQMDILIGDSNRDRTVNSGDATVVRNLSGQTASAANFVADVNADGTVNSADATIVRNNSGHTVGPSTERPRTAEKRAQ